jgi:hypothetical protein
MSLEERIGEVATAIAGHLSQLTYDEKEEFLDLLDDRIDDLRDDITDEDIEPSDDNEEY